MLNPLLLWFLPLALVPVLLHLVTLYRLRTVELSTFRFLMDSYTRQRRQIGRASCRERVYCEV